jgi:type II secretory pathway pseudopilin PulG
MIELLVVIAAISALGMMTYVSSSNVKQSSEEAKLESDVATLNRAIDLYRASGGTIAADATADQVIAKLKTRASSASAAETIGAKGGFLDIRTEAVWQSSPESSTSQLRALWNPSTMTFTTARSSAVAGIKEFRINNDLADATITTETRTPTLKGATSSKWVWDYSTAVAATATPGSNPGVGITGGALGAAVSQGFEGGYWTVTDPLGRIDVSYIFREAGYNSRLGLFSLQDMGPDRYDLTTLAGREDFMREAIRRVLQTDGTELGSVIIDASQSLVGFGQQYIFRPGDTMAAILIPNTSFQDSLNRLENGTSNSQTYPLLSLSYGDNSGSFYVSQIAGLGNSAYAIEDISGNSSDNDYNDLIFQAFGLTEPDWSATRTIDPLTYYINQPYWTTPNPNIGISIRDALVLAGVIPP